MFHMEHADTPSISVRELKAYLATGWDQQLIEAVNKKLSDAFMANAIHL